MKTPGIWWVTFFLGLGVSSCRPAPSPPIYRATASIQDLMDALIDPSADALWASISREITLDGEIVRQPTTDEEWAELRRHAVRILEAADLLTTPGRRVARPGAVSENPGIELSPEGIERRIRSDTAQWTALSYRLHDVARESLRAIEQKDVKRLFDSGEQLDAVCEQCHSVYWYPDDAAHEAAVR